MLRPRIGRIETLLQRRADRPVVWTAKTCVKAVRRLLVQLDMGTDHLGADPFPDLEGEDYLLAFWPWLLANAERFPRWALEYAFGISGLLVRDLDRRVDAGAPAPRQLQTAHDVVALLEEQVAALRADQGPGVVARARAVGYLASIARQAIETANLEARLEMLERVLKERQGPAR